MSLSQSLYGVHTDMDAETYHALPGASASLLKRLWQTTPAHLQASLKEPREATPAMMMGTLAHSVILEPDKPLPRIAIQPEEYEPGKKWTYSAKACKEWRSEQERNGLIVLKADEYDAVLGMASSIAAHPIASPMLAKGRAETSLVAEDTANRVTIRARLDFIPDEPGYLLDVKTTASASARDFERKAFESGFHIQSALYLALWNALTDDRRTGFRFIAVENKPPFAVNVFECSPEFLARGSEDFKRTLALYARCVHEESWPAFTPTLNTLSLPRWAGRED